MIAFSGFYIALVVLIVSSIVTLAAYKIAKSKAAKSPIGLAFTVFLFFFPLFGIVIFRATPTVQIVNRDGIDTQHFIGPNLSSQLGKKCLNNQTGQDLYLALYEYEVQNLEFYERGGILHRLPLDTTKTIRVPEGATILIDDLVKGINREPRESFARGGTKRRPGPRYRCEWYAFTADELSNMPK